MHDATHPRRGRPSDAKPSRFGLWCLLVGVGAGAVAILPIGLLSVAVFPVGLAALVTMPSSEVRRTMAAAEWLPMVCLVVAMAALIVVANLAPIPAMLRVPTPEFASAVKWAVVGGLVSMLAVEALRFKAARSTDSQGPLSAE